MSYIKTMNGVKYLVQHELDMASDEHGERFNSPHEAYAVIKEEVDETREDLDDLGWTMEALWALVKNDDKIGKYLEKIESTAMRCACEAIQVAAMARKAMR